MLTLTHVKVKLKSIINLAESKKNLNIALRCVKPLHKPLISEVINIINIWRSSFASGPSNIGGLEKLWSLVSLFASNVKGN